MCHAVAARSIHEEEDTFVSYEEEDTCVMVWHLDRYMRRQLRERSKVLSLVGLF
jgi:hypothetical protein